MPAINIQITVETQYSEEHSRAEEGRYVFLYRIQIRNQSEYTVQLLSRYWKITDAHGVIEEVRGAGVVGKQPILRAGEVFSYTSACPLSTRTGSMQGHYVMQVEEENFKVPITEFALTVPGSLH